MGRRRRKQKLPAEPVAAHIDSLSHDGRGVAHIDGKATFIHGALPQEEVLFKYTSKRKKHDEGDLLEVIKSSPDRVLPKCEYFGLCGGCSLQHMDAGKQIEYKQQTLIDALSHIGKVVPDKILQPLVNSSPWGYRRKARLGVKDVIKKGRVLVGFRERSASFVADMDQCEVLHPKVGYALKDLVQLISSMELKNRIPQIEVAMDDERCVLIFRVLEELGAEDRQRLKDFSETKDFIIYLQSGGPDTVQPLVQDADLHYQLPEFDLQLSFLPTDFTQVNSEINQQMISQAIQMLEPAEEDRVLDLFCGIGNFTLPLATRAGQVTGVEGAAELVERARQNALNNSLHNVNFHTANLYEDLSLEPWLKDSFNKVLLDPPRSGAFEILQYLPKLGAERILYVSCYPGTLARDAGALVYEHGYQLVSAGVMDMFPHTAHVESIALFEKY